MFIGQSPSFFDSVGLESKTWIDAIVERLTRRFAEPVPVADKL
jgi:hypothetical protein